MRDTDRPADRRDQSRPSYDGPAGCSGIGLRLSRAEELAYNEHYHAVRDVNERRLKIIYSFIDGEFYNERSRGSLHDAAVKWKIDEHRLLATFIQARKFARDTRDVSDDAAFNHLSPDRRFAFCKSVVELQRFVNRAIKKDDDCDRVHLQQLDLAIGRIANNNFIDWLEDKNREYDGYYTIELLSRALAMPRRIIDVAYPGIIASGVWHGHARVLAGLSDYIDDTKPDYGDDWMPQDFEEQIERSIRLDNEQRERDRIYFDHVDEVIKRGKAKLQAAKLNGKRARLPPDFKL